jgi:nicotinate phosphoribosyltransferase
MYEVDKKWAKHFPELAILLPDTYWTTFYQKNTPKDIINSHIWNRFDSKNPMIAIPEYIDWLLINGIDPMQKSAIPSDWLNAEKAVEITKIFKGKVWFLGFGIGTSLTNNTKWTWPRDMESYWPFWSFSVVVKPSRIKRPNWKWVSTVKLSDNSNKAVWKEKRVEKFKNIFWTEWMSKEKVEV